MSIDIYAEVEKAKHDDDIRSHAIEIYNYMVQRLANGVYISEENKEEMIEDICFLIEGS